MNNTQVRTKGAISIRVTDNHEGTEKKNRWLSFVIKDKDIIWKLLNNYGIINWCNFAFVLFVCLTRKLILEVQVHSTKTCHTSMLRYKTNASDKDVFLFREGFIHPSRSQLSSSSLRLVYPVSWLLIVLSTLAKPEGSLHSVLMFIHE